MLDSLANSIFNIKGYSRKSTEVLSVGGIGLGGDNPIRLQTMTTTNTNNITPTVEQSIRAINAGAEFIRLTTQGVKEAQSLGQVKRELINRGYKTPVIADIHFNPAAALEAAKHADKIRINPGNYSDKSKITGINLSDTEYEQELVKAEQQFLKLLEVCNQNDVAIRIGVNHGSLSQRIMNRYGDTPKGMAYSAIEFLRICNKHKFRKLVVSMKSSNTRVMVQATRLIVKLMADEGMSYPLHLGVTEAGEGEDGRIKSAVGIGALLVDGIGDTIRVSLTEEPENEIPVAKALIDIFSGWEKYDTPIPKSILVNPIDYLRRETNATLNIGGENVPVVFANLSDKMDFSIENIEKWGWSYNHIIKQWRAAENSADYIFIGSNSPQIIPNPESLPLVGTDPTCNFRQIETQSFIDLKNDEITKPFFVRVDIEAFNLAFANKLKQNPMAIVILSASKPDKFYGLRNRFFELIENQINNPCIVDIGMHKANIQNFQVMASAIFGPLFLDGLGDGIMISAPEQIPQSNIRTTSFGILQASRVRISKTEFISCPGCGRTLFNLNQTLLKVKEKTAHLKGLKIGVMGCIVNGPGEMADSDYGYVGAGPGRVSLYRKKEVVKKNIPEKEAVDELINLIKVNGDWVDEK
jgi:(E)-4-hydroxy-3-methylbut-2-enyl-diphosphate synthase